MHGRSGQQLRRRPELTRVSGSGDRAAIAAEDALAPGLSASRLSIIVPALDEASIIGRTLTALEPLRARGHEVLVVDGGSSDATRAIAARAADRVLGAPRGRARQMNAGAAHASGDVLVFLHADTVPPADADRLIDAGLRRGARWGRFDVELDDAGWLLRLVGLLMNLRSRITGIATGDQAIFVERGLFEAIGGFADIPLMEDVSLSRRLRAHSRPVCLRARVRTSSRRWQGQGVVRTILLMWRLRLEFALGRDPEHLHRRYERGPGRARRPG